WRACAIGDSCIFHIRNGLLLKSFPLDRSEQFNRRPILLCSNPENNRPVWKAVELAEGECQEGDQFLALTDALAKWFLCEVEAGRRPWKMLEEIQNGGGFKKFVQQLRAAQAIRNDDTTLLSIRWIAEEKGKSTEPSRKAKVRGSL
ncbi:MAG TPA: hypothetical protein VK633_08080, partial [Verrucomicrobiae bacterium]|nr:hypothetical protein [Verrucomicrobiae bacterium]